MPTLIHSGLLLGFVDFIGCRYPSKKKLSRYTLMSSSSKGTIIEDLPFRNISHCCCKKSKKSALDRMIAERGQLEKMLIFNNFFIMYLSIISGGFMGFSSL